MQIIPMFIVIGIALKMLLDYETTGDKIDRIKYGKPKRSNTPMLIVTAIAIMIVQLMDMF